QRVTIATLHGNTHSIVARRDLNQLAEAIDLALLHSLGFEGATAFQLSQSVADVALIESQRVLEARDVQRALCETN
ncbi:MAG: hypothetical protein L0Y42_01290, partial [Phycisphaerales bacterium]|nr:hypothetical protein [Phycisphaerales bacterium]